MKTKNLVKKETEKIIVNVFQSCSTFECKGHSPIFISYFVIEKVLKEEGVFSTATAHSFDSLAEELRCVSLDAHDKTELFEACYSKVEPFTISKKDAWCCYLMSMFFEYNLYKGWKDMVSSIQSNSGRLYGKNIHDVFKVKEVLGISEENYQKGFCYESIEEYDEQKDLTNILTHVLSEIVGREVTVTDGVIR